MQKFINKYTLIFIGIYIFWLGILPNFLSGAISAVCRNLSHNSSYNIVVENPRVRFSFLPVGYFYADRINAISKTDKTGLDIANFKVKVRLLPLLSGNVHINNLRAEKFDISTTIQEEIALDKEFFKELEKARFSFDSLNLGDFKIQLSQKDMKTPIVYSGKGLSFKNKNRYLELNVESSLNIDNKESEVNARMHLPKNSDIKRTAFDVSVSNLNLEPFGFYFKHYLPKNILGLSGTVNISANKDELLTELNNCKITMKEASNSIIFPNKMDIKSKFSISQRTLNFDFLDIDSDKIHAKINGKIFDYLGKAMPTLDLNIQIDKSKIEDFIDLMPGFKVEDIDTYKLKKYKFFGDILGNITIKGRLPEPDITGEVFINNGILIKPIPNTAAGATIKLKLTGRNINYNVFVPAGSNEKVWVDGSQELYNIKYADLTVKSTQKVNLQSAQNVVNPLHEILNFIIGPVPIMDIHGTGNVDLQIKGNRKNPHVWGKLNFYDATVKFIEMPNLVLTNADAVLTFNDQNAVFVSQKGLVNNKEFKLSGTCDLFGKFNFDVISQGQPTSNLYNAVRTSSLIGEMQKMLPPLDKISGSADLNLKVYGAVKYIEDLKFNENAFTKGEITLKDNNFVFQNITAEKTSGKIKIDGLAAETDLNALVGNSPMSIKAKVKNDIADLTLNIPNLNPNFIISDLKLREKQYLPYVSCSAKYKGSASDIEYDKLNLDAKILASNPKSNIKFNSGEIITQNGRIVIKNLKGYIDNKINSFYADLKIQDAFTDKPEASGVVGIKAPDVTVFNDIIKSDILPQNIKKYTKDYELKKGIIKFDGRFINGKLNAESDLGGISFVYLPLELPVNILNGSISVKNNSMYFNKINVLADKMPILLDGSIKDIFAKKNFDIYVNTKPQQEFIDQYINKNQIYPLKIKGDIVCWAKLKGVLENYDLKTQVNMNKNSIIYHYGATIGDVENAISMYIDSKISGKNVKLKEFSYDKIVDSLSGKQTRLNLLKAAGGVDLLKDDLMFKDLHIKTNQPTDARIFNIIFRKPNIKQGQFTSDLRINGKLSNPKVAGTFNITETNIPFMETTVKNVAMVFKDRTIDINSKGDVLGNDFKFEGILKNKLTTPYHIENASLYTKDLDLNKIVSRLKVANAETESIIESAEDTDYIKILTFDNFKFKADKIELRNIQATGFEAQTSLDDKGVFNVEHFGFNIASGNLNGKYKYNFNNNDVYISLNADSIDANEITIALFDLRNQIYGDMTGKVALSCNGSDFKSCMQTLNGETSFNVKDGRMPKLGSLEYLLKAGNLLKGGITGLSINSVIDLITPLKTGEFSEILGNIVIKDGVANEIEISTKGKDLSLFITGTYNFATAVADMDVFGLLSRKISTMFGPIGNMSINTLFNVIPGIDLSKDSTVLNNINKIPGIEITSKAYRKFLAVIKGDINEDNYVTEFNWIN